MSYREQRNVTDLLRRMGYPRIVSLESFRQPNFLLLADILRWFMKRYDSTADILNDIDTEQQRVNFIRNFVQHMLRKAGLKLNPKRLYQADGYAVKEITKVIQFFSNATKEANEIKMLAGNQGKDVLTQFYEFQPSLHKIRSTRELSTILTERGVSFYDLITKEITNRTTRDALLSKPFDLKDYEHIVRKSISAVKTEEVKIQASIETSENTINSLNTKIEKKRQELERSEQRLETMAKVRPAYMDEYEKLQKELENLYHDYVTRFRILCHLQHQMDEMSRMEDVKRNEAKLLKTNSNELMFRNGRPRTAGIGDEFSGSEVEEDEEDESLLDDSLQQQNGREFLMTRSNDANKAKAGGGVRPQGTAKNGMSLSGTNSRSGGGGDLNELVMPMPNRTRSSRNMNGGIDMYGSALDDDEDESESDMLILEGENSGSEIDEETDLLMSKRGGGGYTAKPDQIPRQGQSSKASSLKNGNISGIS